MTPDVNIKSYYLQFINKASTSYSKHRLVLIQGKEYREKLVEYLEEHKSVYKHDINIDLDAYKTEWSNKTFNDEELLFKDTLKSLKVETDADKRNKLVQIIKYCYALKTIKDAQDNMDFDLLCKNIKFRDFESKVYKYYSKVNEVVLNGDGYRFTNGIGTYVCNYWKLDPNRKNAVKRLDRRATNLRKQELKDKGVKLFNSNEAHWYKVRNIPYDGVDYRVYLDKNYFYEFTVIHSKFMANSNLQFSLVDTISKKYRGMSHGDIADRFIKNESDIHKMQVDPRVKLNLLILKVPNVYLRFVRNLNMVKYEDGPHK